MNDNTPIGVKGLTFRQTFISQTAIKNNIGNRPADANVIDNIKAAITNIWDKIPSRLNPVINSFYRSPKLNALVGGSTTSQHVTGEAIDIDSGLPIPTATAEIFRFIANNLDFDQLIWEFGNDNAPDWVHVSYRRVAKNRKQMLRAHRIGRKVTYSACNADGSFILRK